ncbi:hypothetical protein L6E12_16985 [Actinokineospora sp. PR83]|uniref:hypothetical protein n=1 Tax=Actinokineospora sp. PR83 TaxID=2884908 RepID=UPI001F1BBB6A|nr:hypothetical protein [Actinokineospora sp. PR83]MCG8917482.1 hypothetical protein [Actinokineospora sp. PR83]
MTAPARTAPLLRAWITTVTVAELVGFTVPVLVGAVTADAPTAVALPGLVAAGAAEGALLGWGQARVLRRVVPGLPRVRWTAHTAAGTALAYLLGMLPSTLDAPWGAAVVGLPLLLSLGLAQFPLLRGRVRWAAHWVWVTAVAWVAGMAVFLCFATPLWHEGQQTWQAVAIGIAGGALMATTAAVVSGLALVRLSR